ncbi:MAG: RES family NAD+ phosphorylase [Chitinophagaceae bacterium]|nr:RES family NAD+ phosphorylase [Chitinophagaceae bacterium]
MNVYRISRSRYAEDLTGEGARLFGGRWNSKNVPCIYASESRALAMVEYSVNVNMHDIPRALSLVTYEIDAKKVVEIDEEFLPGNWRNSPIPKQTQSFGSLLLSEKKYEIVRIPSVVIPEEFNFLINPNHHKGKIKIVSITDFLYDIRLKKV